MYIRTYICVGGRTADAIVQAAMNTVKETIVARMSGRSGGSKSSGGSGGSSGSDDVIQLTDGNFEELVIHSSEPWLVEFFAPW